MPRLSYEEHQSRLHFRWGQMSGTWRSVWTGERRPDGAGTYYRVDGRAGRDDRSGPSVAFETRSLDAAESAFRMLAAKGHHTCIAEIVYYEDGDHDFCVTREISNPPSDVLALLVATAPPVCVSGVHQIALSEGLAEARRTREKEERVANRVTRRQWQERKAVDRGVPSARSISPKVRAVVLERDNFRCRRCGAAATDTLLVVDHVTPVASGGTADASNLQTLCADCNMGKGAREPHAHDLRVAQ